MEEVNLDEVTMKLTDCNFARVRVKKIPKSFGFRDFEK